MADFIPISAGTGITGGNDYVYMWSLGVDVPVLYRCLFSISAGQFVKIEGWNKNLGLAEIRYSAVNRNGVQPVYIDSVHVDEGNFQFKFVNLPAGENYEIEVYNYGCGLCHGAFNLYVLTSV